MKVGEVIEILNKLNILSETSVQAEKSILNKVSSLLKLEE